MDTSKPAFDYPQPDYYQNGAATPGANAPGFFYTYPGSSANAAAQMYTPQPPNGYGTLYPTGPGSSPEGKPRLSADHA